MRTKLRAAGIALLCSACQIALLEHELLDCLPYKIMPQWRSYRSAGLLAAILGSLLAVAVASALTSSRSRRTILLMPLVAAAAALATPLTFAFAVNRAVPPTAADLASEAPDFTPSAAWDAFRHAALNVALLGVVVSVIVALAVAIYLSRAEESAA